MWSGNQMKRKSKFITIAVTTIVEMLLAVLGAFIAHQYFFWFTNLGANTVVLKLDLNYVNAVKALIRQPECKLWFLVIEMIYLFWLIYILIRPSAEIASIREIAVTDKIKIPVPAGNGQHGNERFATEKEKEEIFDTLIFTGHETITQSGVVVEMIKKNGAEVIRYVSGPRSVIIIGATRSGKTRRVIFETLWLQLMSGTSVVLSDMKGELFYYTSAWAKSLGYETIAIDLRNPRKSVHYNFCQPIINALKQGDRAQAIDYTWDLVSVLVGEQKGEPLWYNGETATLAAAILAVCIEAAPEEHKNKVKEISYDIYELMNSFRPTEEALDELESEEERERIKGEIWKIETNLMCSYTTPYIEELKRSENKEAIRLIEEIEKLQSIDNTQCKNITNVYYFLAYMAREDPNTGKTPLSLYLDTLPDSHPAKTVFMQGQIAAERTRSSFYTSALGTLKLFTNPNIEEMTSCSDFDLGSLGNKKTIIYMMIPDEKRTLYPLASILIQQIYMELVKNANQHGGRLPIPCDFDLDEVGNFPVIPILAPMVTAGQSRGVRVNLPIQDYQQLEKKYKEDFDTIKSNCAIKIYLKTDSPKTLKEISDYLGKYTVEVTSASSSANNTKLNEGSISSSSNLGGRELLMPAEISHITAPYALVMNQGTFSSITQLPDLSEYRVNKLWGLGDETHNRKLIEQREAERIERELRSVPLWGIWVKYKKMLEEDAADASEVSFLR